MKVLTIEMPIPAHLLSYRFPEGKNATIEYATGESLKTATVLSVTIPFLVFGEITDVAELSRQCELAANHNAHVYWQGKTVDEFADILP